MGFHMILPLPLGTAGRSLEGVRRTKGAHGRETRPGPGPQLRQIEASILLHDGKLDGTDVGLVSLLVRDRASRPSQEPKHGNLRRRQAQLSTLDRRRTMAMTVSPSLAVVPGEAGIGKTRLVSAWAAKVDDQGVTVIYGRCDEDTSGPYQPLVEAIRPLLLAATSGERGVLASSAAAEHLSSIFPELTYGSGDGAHTASSGPDSDRDRLFSSNQSREFARSPGIH